jgi:hypothetical protein
MNRRSAFVVAAVVVTVVGVAACVENSSSRLTSPRRHRSMPRGHRLFTRPLRPHGDQVVHGGPADAVATEACCSAELMAVVDRMA